MNQLTIVGNLVKPPELRSTQDGTPVCGFTVAVNRPKSKNNQNPGADYVDVTVWRERAESCAKFLTKGSKVCVIGAVSVRTWETQDGRHGANLEIKGAKEVEFLSKSEPSIDPQSGMTIVETDELPL